MGFTAAEYPNDFRFQEHRLIRLIRCHIPKLREICGRTFVFPAQSLAYHSLLILCSKMPVCIQAERQDHEVAHTLTREIRRIGGAFQGES